MNYGIRFLMALLAGWALLTPAALADNAAGPLPAGAAAHKAVPPKPGPPHPGPLNPGKSAGVRAAQQEQGHTGLALLGAGGAIIAVIAVTAGSSGGGNGGAQPNSQSVPATTP
ncbi:MAG: hypothetical protein H0U98_07355 [Alphaproteobacteria bacterium]|nr:hypothetical protein [Alphaproteobacteria bacterium]